MADVASGLYTFRSWMKRGISGQQKLDDPLRASVTIGVSVGAIDPSVKLFLHGPRDVKGLDQRVVIRTWPKDGASSAEPNYFPLIEFDQPDLPWRYSPEPPQGDKVKPWLCVIVLREDDAKNFSPAKASQPLGVLNVATSLLPELDESALWAHVQIHGPNPPDDATLAQKLVSERNTFSSRILAVGLLQPEKEYKAFLVPTFEAGRLAGLGQDVGPTNASKLAWTKDVPSIALPVYHHWSFHTGPAGDFRSLVKKLHPPTKPFPETFGKRKMKVDQPRLDLPEADAAPMDLEGVLLRYPRTARAAWIGPLRDTFVQRLTELLNLPAKLYKASQKIVVMPPLYGRWHAAEEEVKTTSAAWFQELNEDPRNRVFAGAGTLAVQAKQQDYLAEAWDQVGEVRKANHSSLWAEVAMRVAERLHLRIFSLSGTGAATPESVIKYTAPVHSRVLGSPVTIARLIQQSPISAGLTDPRFRRIARPLGPLGRRQGRAGSRVVPNILERMNRGEYSPAPPPPVPESLSTLDRIGIPLVPSWATTSVRDFLRLLPQWLSPIGLLLLVLALVLLVGAAASAPVLAMVAVVGAAGLVSSPIVRRLSQNLDARADLSAGKLSAEQIDQLPIRSSFVPVEYTPGNPSPVPVATTAGKDGGLNEAAANFRQAASELFAHLNLPPVEPAPLRSVALDDLKQKLSVALDPNRTVVQAFHSRLTLESGVYQIGIDGTGQIMHAPSFNKHAMYDEMKALSQDWVLPGMELIESNSVSLLTTNQKSVEAFMVGVNHEMARTLLFNEYPTDQRGSYFRQFWNSSGAAGQTQNPEDFLDIKPIHQWGRTDLGQNTARKLKAKDDDVVLCVRGEVLLRYPNTIIYAAKAVKNAAGQKPALILPADNDLASHMPHIFHGELGADIRFFGFPLDIGAALGEDGSDGWFFVLQQHPEEPLFGLNVGEALPGEPQRDSAHFTDLITWNSLLAGVVAAPGVTHLSFESTKLKVEPLFAAQGPLYPNWGKSSAEVAQDTMRTPSRVAFHARLLIRR
jgi:hypothetical protein